MPRDTLTREQIVRAAIDLLDTEGLEGLNMRALGNRLGSAATAVYWHVGSKDNLMALAADQAWNEIALPDLTATGWRAAATAMATSLHAMLTRHPWLVQAFGSQVLYGPGTAPPRAPPACPRCPPAPPGWCRPSAPRCCPAPARPATTTTPSPSTRRPDSAARGPARQRPPSSPSCSATPSAQPRRPRSPASSAAMAVTPRS